jgi:hypothetical protein
LNEFSGGRHGDFDIAPFGSDAMSDLSSEGAAKRGKYRPETLAIGVRAGAIFRNGFIVICPVQPYLRK